MNELRRIGRISILLGVLLCVALISTASAGEVTLERSFLQDEAALDHYAHLSPDEQTIVLKALEETYSESKFEETTAELKKIWDGTSALEETEKRELLASVIASVFTYYCPDTSRQISPMWGGAIGENPDGVHNALAGIAGQKRGWGYSQTKILDANSRDPDTWGLEQMVEHYLDGAPFFSNAPDKCSYYANEARTQMRSNPYSESAWRCLSWSMHYMSDLSMPWHTQGVADPAQLATHTLYEGYVQEKFTDPEYGFKAALVSAPNTWVVISDPASSARSLASYSSARYSGLQLKIVTIPFGWGEDDWVKSTTKDLLKEGLKYNMGLVEYATH
ncbi:MULTISPECIES: phospholipase C/P1 nuclease family protein [Methanoculleus]|uniref:Uncharacterized protein n=3 Tax=Methanoculleus TaxID=45989 RepID=A0A0X3BGQ9_9EURY|nr:MULTISPECIES: hypothetical protein [Methanoculleus]NMA88281.1 hypothetical protein [Methanoculleus bourgensis]NQS74487.1 hypothetical protein [Methanoculleus sp.]UYU17546.1 hypothetical protein OH143_07450 [Methanoculleus submarinus]CVK31298.1 conserved exported protein of unknown function [Methanoculleus bourgensis]